MNELPEELRGWEETTIRFDREDGAEPVVVTFELDMWRSAVLHWWVQTQGIRAA